MANQQIRQSHAPSKVRRSQRVPLSLAILAYRSAEDGPPFFEGTRTVVVSAHGALIDLAASVSARQTLFLQNSLSGEKQECRIVSTIRQPGGLPKVAVEFRRPAPNFWGIAFPPRDWALAS